MDGPQLGLLFGPRAAYQESHSAQPAAPVVVSRRRRSRTGQGPAARTRTSVAGLLHHVADAITPSTAQRGGTATQ